MSIFYSAYFLKTETPPELLRKRFSQVITLPESEWKICNYGKDFVDGLFEGTGDFTLDLSKRFGEVIFVCTDTRNNQFEYEHSQNGKILRKLCWCFDGNESTWLVVEGERESWEDKVVFSHSNLEKSLEMLRYIVEDEETDDYESRSAELKQLFQNKTYRLEEPWPLGDASLVEVIQSHFGIQRPEL